MCLPDIYFLGHFNDLMKFLESEFKNWQPVMNQRKKMTKLF